MQGYLMAEESEVKGVGKRISRMACSPGALPLDEVSALDVTGATNATESTQHAKLYTA
jgi:hypothetical protein